MQAMRCKWFVILEATCFDGVISSHETDIDCGGEFCSPCNISEVRITHRHTTTNVERFAWLNFCGFYEHHKIFP